MLLLVINSVQGNIALLDNPILVEGAQKKALDIIKTHFTYSSDEIYQAYQDSSPIQSLPLPLAWLLQIKNY
jgi:hypothetical protein